MSEAEIWELIVQYNSNGISGLAVYFTILTTYLFAAYTVGDKLTSVQCTIVTSGFVVLQGLAVYGTAGSLHRAAFLIRKTTEEYRSSVMMNESYLYVFTFLLLGGLAAALKFMWDIRHAKAE